MLTGKAIVAARERGEIVIDPFDPACVNPNSYDLTLGNTYRYPNYPFDKTESFEFDSFELQTGQLYLFSTNEVAGSNTFVPCISGKSSLARLGLSVHQTAGFGDVGFVGQWTLEVTVVRPVWVHTGMRICQVYFIRPEGELTQYTGKYQGQKGPTQAR